MLTQRPSSLTAMVAFRLLYSPSVRQLASLPLTPKYTHGLRIAHVNSANATSQYVSPVLANVVEIIKDLVGDLQGTGLSGCGCTSQDILGLVSETLQVLLPSPPVVFSDAHVLWDRSSLNHLALHAVHTLVYCLLLVNLCQ